MTKRFSTIILSLQWLAKKYWRDSEIYIKPKNKYEKEINDKKLLSKISKEEIDFAKQLCIMNDIEYIE